MYGQTFVRRHAAHQADGALRGSDEEMRGFL